MQTQDNRSRGRAAKYERRMPTLQKIHTGTEFSTTRSKAKE